MKHPTQITFLSRPKPAPTSGDLMLHQTLGPVRLIKRSHHGLWKCALSSGNYILTPTNHLSHLPAE